MMMPSLFTVFNSKAARALPLPPRLWWDRRPPALPSCGGSRHPGDRRNPRRTYGGHAGEATQPGSNLEAGAGELSCTNALTQRLNLSQFPLEVTKCVHRGIKYLFDFVM